MKKRNRVKAGFRGNVKVESVTHDGDQAIVVTSDGTLRIDAARGVEPGAELRIQLSEKADKERKKAGAQVTADLIEVVEASSKEPEVRTTDSSLSKTNGGDDEENSDTKDQ